MHLIQIQKTLTLKLSMHQKQNERRAIVKRVNNTKEKKVYVSSTACSALQRALHEWL